MNPILKSFVHHAIKIYTFLRGKRIRAVAICVLYRQKDASLLVGGWTDKKTGVRFCRPLGGGIDFWEHSEVTIRREIKEEIGADLTNLRFLKVIESIYQSKNSGQRSHQYYFVYRADFVDPAFYDLDMVQGHEDFNIPFRAYWTPLSNFETDDWVLYPDGLLDMINIEVE